MTVLPALRSPKIDLPDTISRIDVPSVDVDLSGIAGSLSETAAAAARMGRPERRPRWPFALGGLVVASVAGWAILSNQQLRSSLTSRFNAAREWIRGMRSGADRSSIDGEEPVAFQAAETRPIETDALTDPFIERASSDAPDYPPGLGSNNGDEVPAFEKTGSRA